MTTTRLTLLSSFCAVVTLVAASQATASTGPLRVRALGPGGDEFHSSYSHILVRERNAKRSLLFVRDNGEVVLESEVDMRRPWRLVVPYTRTMFASYLFKPKHNKVLIIGLGGGSMVHFLKRYAPDLRVHAVEIDPMIVQVAQQYFGVASAGNVRIHTADGFAYLKETQERYDVIYMDAFLKPSADTDSTGVPLRLKTIAFFRSLRGKLTTGGMVVFNINSHASMGQDISAIREAFPSVYVFKARGSGNTIVVGSTSETLHSATQLRELARKLDDERPASLSFTSIAGEINERLTYLDSR